MQAELAEMTKVASVGSGGAFATIALSDVSTLVSIAVGIVTFCYVSAKLFYLVKSGGKNEAPKDDKEGK